MTKVLQITPEIGPGTGVGAVAHHLEEAWQRQGIEVSRFTLAEAHGGWLPRGSAGVSGRLALIARVVWFSTVGSVLARRHLRRRPELLSVCHNDAVAGDVYVNHGLVQVAMRARGNYVLRMVRNPLHLFTTARDRLRYGSVRSHRAVVNLVSAEESLLREVFPRLRLPSTVIGNGVDVERFRPATDAQRALARDELGLGPEDKAVLFIGNEFGRKGLPMLVSAVGRLPSHVHLVVVGGSDDMISAEAERADARTLGDRLHFVGATPDPRSWLHGADALAMPSAYESYGLVVLEALACGLPVVGTRTGCVPDVVTDGETGAIVDATTESLADGLSRALALPPERAGTAARRTAVAHSWDLVAGRYLDLMRSVHGASSSS